MISIPSLLRPADECSHTTNREACSAPVLQVKWKTHGPADPSVAALFSICEDHQLKVPQAGAAPGRAIWGTSLVSLDLDAKEWTLAPGGLRREVITIEVKPTLRAQVAPLIVEWLMCSRWVQPAGEPLILERVLAGATQECVRRQVTMRDRWTAEEALAKAQYEAARSILTKAWES